MEVLQTRDKAELGLARMIAQRARGETICRSSAKTRQQRTRHKQSELLGRRPRSVGALVDDLHFDALERWAAFRRELRGYRIPA
jgi:hypothetical protein